MTYLELQESNKMGQHTRNLAKCVAHIQEKQCHDLATQTDELNFT